MKKTIMTNDLAGDNKPVFDRKHLINLIWPLLIEQLLTVLVGMADVLMVAVLGETAVSGVSLVDAINYLIIQVLFAMTAGGTVVCAQYIGGKKERQAGRTTAQLLLLTLIGTVIVMVAFLFGGNALLQLMYSEVEPDVMSNAAIYLRITALSFPFLALYNVGAAAFRASSNTKVSMVCSLIMNGINIGGNAVCVFGLKMGVAGVAIPTLIARGIGAVLILLLLQRGKRMNPARVRSISDFKPDGVIIKKILTIGVPNSIESGLFQLGKIMLSGLVATLGTPSIAAYAVACNLVTYLYLPGNALGASLLTIVGQCYGAGKPEQAKSYTKKLMALNYLMLAAICTVMVIGRHFFVGCYQLEGLSAQLASGLVLSHSIAMVIWPTGFLFPYFFRAIGRARFTMVVAIFTMWVFRIGLAYLFVKGFQMNVLAIWYAMYADWVVRTIIYLTAFRKSKMLKME